MKNKHFIKLLTTIVSICFFPFALSLSIKAQEIDSSIVAQSNTQNQRLSEQEVRKIVQEIHAASQKLNLDGVLSKYATPFVVSEFTLDYLGTTRMTKEVDGREDLKAMMRESYSQLNEIKEIARNVDVYITDNGLVAVVEDDSIVELVDKNNVSHIVTSLTKMRFALIDGQTKLISLESDSHMGVRPFQSD